MRTKSEKRRAKAISKGGRPKAQGERTPSGQLSRSKSGYDSRGARNVAVAQAHRSWLPDEKRLDQHAESILGRLFLAGHISERQFWAGQKMRSIMGEFRSVMASPIVPRSTLVNMIAPGLQPEEDHKEQSERRAASRTEDEIRRHNRVLAEFDRARDALAYDQDAFFAVNAIAVDDRDWHDHGALVRGLEMLVIEYGFQEDKTRKIVGEYVERPAWTRAYREIHFEYDDAHLTNGHKSGSG